MSKHHKWGRVVQQVVDPPANHAVIARGFSPVAIPQRFAGRFFENGIDDKGIATVAGHKCPLPRNDTIMTVTAHSYEGAGRVKTLPYNK